MSTKCQLSPLPSALTRGDSNDSGSWFSTCKYMQLKCCLFQWFAECFWIVYLDRENIWRLQHINVISYLWKQTKRLYMASNYEVFKKILKFHFEWVHFAGMYVTNTPLLHLTYTSDKSVYKIIRNHCLVCRVHCTIQAILRNKFESLRVWV